MKEALHSKSSFHSPIELNDQVLVPYVGGQMELIGPNLLRGVVTKISWSRGVLSLKLAWIARATGGRVPLDEQTWTLDARSSYTFGDGREELHVERIRKEGHLGTRILLFSRRTFEALHLHLRGDDAFDADLVLNPPGRTLS